MRLADLIEFHLTSGWIGLVWIQSEYKFLDQVTAALMDLFAKSALIWIWQTFLQTGQRAADICQLRWMNRRKHTYSDGRKTDVNIRTSVEERADERTHSDRRRATVQRKTNDVHFRMDKRNRQAGRQASRQAGRQAGQQAGRQAGSQSVSQAGRQAGRH